MIRLCLILALLPLAAACDRTPAPPKATPAPARIPRMAVVASVFPLADVARQTGGRAVDASWWIESGQTTDGFSPSDDQLTNLRNARAVLSAGTGDGWITDRIDEAAGDRRLIRLDRFVDDHLRSAQLWLDPSVVKQASGALTQHLVSLEPQFADQFRETGAMFVRKLDTMVDDWRDPLLPLQGKTIASIGSDYAPLARHLGCNLIRLSDRAAIQMTESELADLRRRVREVGAILLLAEDDAPPAVLRNLQEKVDVPVVLIDSLGSSSSTGNDSYERMMRHNFKQLQEGLRRVDAPGR